MIRRSLRMSIACSVLVASSVLGASRDTPHFVSEPDSWFATPDGKQVMGDILTWQMPNGGWPKEYNVYEKNTQKVPHVDTEYFLAPEIRAKLDAHPVDPVNGWDCSTIDNDATRSELILLARAISLSKDDAEKATFTTSFNRGVDCVINGQYPNGGLPQRFPPPTNYGRYITFNDDAMNDFLELILLPIIRQEKPFGFVDAERRGRCQVAFDKGIECILACQVKKDGVLTVWGQQHDEKTLAPAPARAYELPSLTASESSNIVLLLMDLPKPDAREKAAIEGAVAWFKANAIMGKRLRFTTTNGKKDRVVVDDPGAGPIWARFYDLETGKPFFCGRDGVKKGSLAEIEQERRGGYSWYGTWPVRVLDAYPAWKAAHGG